MNKYILSVDPSFRKTGWVLISMDPELFTCSGVNPKDIFTPVACGVIKTEKTKNKLARVADDDVNSCRYIYRELMKLFYQPDYDVVAMCVELPPGGSRSSNAAKSMGIAKAILGIVAEVTKVPTAWIDPKEPKLVATGKKNASKEEMKAVCSAAYPNFEWPKVQDQFEHIADAMLTCWASKQTEVMSMAYQLISAEKNEA